MAGRRAPVAAVAGTVPVAAVPVAVVLVAAVPVAASAAARLPHVRAPDGKAAISSFAAIDDPVAITAGPDGALWYADAGAGTRPPAGALLTRRRSRRAA